MPRPYECLSGTYTGTGAAQTITLGVKPKKVEIINITDGDSLYILTDTMTAATGVVITTAVAAVASQGATFTDRGFSVGTDASVSESAKVFHYIAYI